MSTSMESPWGNPLRGQDGQDTAVANEWERQPVVGVSVGKIPSSSRMEKSLFVSGCPGNALFGCSGNNSGNNAAKPYSM